MICSIDPGASGAIAWFSDEGHLVAVEDLPVVKVKVGKTMRTRLSPAILRSMLLQRKPSFAFLEEVQPMGTNGSIANFSLGKNSGQIEGILCGLEIPLKTVRPKEWQKHYGLSHGDKGASRARAMQIWPGSTDAFARVKDDGRAEACLIGQWGARWMNGDATEASSS